MPNDHLPPRRTVPPPRLSDDFLRAAAGVYEQRVEIRGRCLLCHAEQAPDWTEAALDQLPDVRGVALGHVCEPCLPAAQERAQASRAAARRWSLSEVMGRQIER